MCPCRFFLRREGVLGISSQFFRLRRLCSDGSDFSEKSEAMCQFFDKRGDPAFVVQAGPPPCPTNRFLLWFFPGGDRLPPGFFGYHQENRFKIGKMYEALTAMVFNRLL